VFIESTCGKQEIVAQVADPQTRRRSSENGAPAGPAGEPPCRDCLGRDLFDGRNPDTDAVPPEIRADQRRTFGQFLRDHRRWLLSVLAAGAAVTFALVVLPQITGMGETLHRLRQGSKAWLAVGVVFQALSIFGYIALFRTVFSCPGVRIGWRESYQITLAGVVATKLFAAAGAGGIALTAWALRSAGLNGRTVARRMAGFEILLYAIYMGALVVFGLGLAIGVLHGRAPGSLTLVPASLGALVIGLVLAFGLLPGDIERRLRGLSKVPTRARRLLERLATVPRTVHEGLVTAFDLLRSPRPGLLGAVAYWGFDIATLWATFHAFGAAPPIPVVVIAYFVGMLANAIPIPGGVGGVEGGLIGALLAFGVNGSAAILAVLAYRALSYWLPLLPGTAAYFQLRRTVGRWRGSKPTRRAERTVPVTA
jgi:uncharacterized protein (TIRG00374 family)